MAIVVFLRGANVGGHRVFRPSEFAKKLSRYGVVNIGAAGTFVVRKPGTRAKFCAELRKHLPFATEMAVCDARDVLRLEKEHPFEEAPPNIVRFVSVLSKAGRAKSSLPCAIPASGEWFVRVIALDGRFAFGEYRRHMKTIGYLGQVDKLFNVTVTTRNWNTIGAIVKVLKKEES